ncbi:MAG: STY4851/ECs_5259 family protein, partial [Pirellulaceae bacterium]
TERGLEWWGQPLVETQASVRFLTTIACQGGLPLQVLKQEANRLRQYFRKVLVGHEQFPTRSIVEVAREWESLLPAKLQTDEVFELTASLIQKVGRLRQRLVTGGAAATTDPMLWLDRNGIPWRDELPLRMADHVASSLINGLLCEPPVLKLAEPLYLVTQLHEDCGMFEVRRELHFAPTLSEAEVRAQVFSTGNVQARCELWLNGDGDRIPAATLIRRGTRNEFRCERLAGQSLRGRSAIREVRLDVLISMQPIQDEPVVLRGGESLPDAAWVFENEKPGRLLGVGSLSARNESVLVAVPGDCELQAEGDAALVPLGEIADLKRRVYRVSGAARVVARDGVTSTIRTRQTSDKVRTFELRGKRRRLGPNGSEVWLGFPQFWESAGTEDAPQQVSSAEIQWRPRHAASAWSPLNPRCLGEVLIRVLRGGELLTQHAVIVFPASFTLTLTPKGENQGCIECGGAGAVVTPGPECCAAVDCLPNGGVRIRVDGRQLPPSLLFHFDFGGGSRAAVHITCPAPSISIVDCTGRSVDWATIPIDHLDGLRLQAMFAESGCPVLVDQYGLAIGRLLSAGESKTLYTLPLSWVKNRIAGILARSADPDGSVKLAVELHRHQQKRLFTFQVSRHAGALHKEALSDRFRLRIPAEAGWKAGATPARLDARRMADPQEFAPADAILEVEPGCWDFMTDRAEPGLWLLTAWLDHRTCLQPLRVTSKTDYVPQIDPSQLPPEDQFAATVNLSNPTLRMAAWDSLVSGLAKNLGHPGWISMDALVNTCNQLPVSTFEGLAALTRNPDAMAIVGLRLCDDGERWRQLELLPFLWSLVPLQSWVNAVQRFQEFMESPAVNRSSAEVTNVLIHFKKTAPLRCPSLQCLTDYFRKSEARPTDTWTFSDELDKELPCLLGKLIFKHEHALWPEHLPATFVAAGADAEAVGLSVFDEHKPVVHAPVVAARVALGRQVSTESLVAEIQNIRGFDTEWFDQAQRLVMCLMIQRGLGHA